MSKRKKSTGGHNEGSRGRGPTAPSASAAGSGAGGVPSAFLRAAHPVRSTPPVRHPDSPRTGADEAGRHPSQPLLGDILARAAPLGSAPEKAHDGDGPPRRAPQRPAGSGASGLAGEALPLDSLEGPWPRLLRRRPAGPVDVGRAGWALLELAEPQAISATYWFVAPGGPDPGDTRRPGVLGRRPTTLTSAPVTVRIAGRRRPDDAQPEPYAKAAPGGSRRWVDEERRLDVPLPAGDLVAWTIRLEDLAAGDWDLSVTPLYGRSGPVPPAKRPAPGKLSTSARTVFAPLAKNRAPGAWLGAWPSLVVAGAVAGLSLQHVLARRFELDAWLVTLLSVLACLVGLVGAKSYYVLTHLRERRDILTTGMSVQGFVIGVLVTLGASLLEWGLPPGAVLDVSIPALLTGLAVGRLGCLLGGCCVGRPTGSRWGIWSSDRSLGVRRIPVQLLESASAAVLAVATWAVLVATGTGSGLLFVAGLSMYVLARQLLFPFRALGRATRYGRRVTTWVSAVVAVVSAVMVAAGA